MVADAHRGGADGGQALLVSGQIDERYWSLKRVMCVHWIVCPREVEIAGATPDLFVGVCRPDADPRAAHVGQEDTTAWLMEAEFGSLCGNGKEDDDEAGGFDEGDRMGVLLDLDDGSLLFFKNGAKHGPGYPAGSVTGPVAAAVQMHFADGGDDEGNAVRLLPGAAWPAGHSP